MSIHLIKLVVGLSTVEEFEQNQPRYLVDYNDKKANVVTTRHRPKQAEELLHDGSLYRVMKNTILFRQKIIGFEEAEFIDKGRMCLIMCDPQIIRTLPTPRRPFQGWRYLKGDDAPSDLDGFSADAEESGDIELAQMLKTAGII